MSDDADDTDLDDLLDEMTAPPPTKKRGAVAVPLTRGQKAAQTRAKAKAEAERLSKAESQRLAQIVNLTLAGFSYADIGAQIGATADEVEQMITRDSARYVRTQSALRQYVKAFVSEKYMGLLDAHYDQATDKSHTHQLEHSAQSLRILKEMTNLYGAAAPTQTEVKVEAAPETVQKMVDALAAGEGLAFDTSVFDTVPGEVIREAVVESHQVTERAEAAIDSPDPDEEGDDPW